MTELSDIIAKVLRNHPEASGALIEKAYAYSVRMHEGKKWMADKPSLPHSVAVADILADMNLDGVSVAAGLLHDVLEDPGIDPQDFRSEFGEEIHRLVSGVTRISALTFQGQAQQAENIRKMILAMADDIRVILIKLADRLHNMRGIELFPPERQAAFSKETLDVYASIAARLGIYWIKNELEVTAFKYAYPQEYRTIKDRINRERSDREAYIGKVKGILERSLAGHGVTCEVSGRFKTYYSIYTKMMSQNLPFEEIYDIIAFRVIVDTIPQCYEVLGYVHADWKPIPKKFKDYIGFPKPNMYRSLHTTVIGPLKDRIEIQIRTWDMEEVAKSGIAAHWSYKEGKKVNAEESIGRFTWIQNLVENQAGVQDPTEFMENVRIDLFPDEIYVFTPDGEIKAIAKGATPVDFAYLIHTEVGNRCCGAKVDGRMVPLSFELKTGNMVEIITAKGHVPSKDWIKFVRTVKAKSRIRQWIKSQERERSLVRGRDLCEKTFRKHGLSFGTLLKSGQLQETAEGLGFKDAEDLIVAVGYNRVPPLHLMRKFEIKAPEEAPRIAAPSSRKKKKDSSGVLVKGIDHMLIRFGKCCKPVRGDAVTGYITKGQGVTVHRAACAHISRLNPDRQIEVSWNRDSAGTYPVNIAVTAEDRKGILTDIATVINKQGPNILSAESSSRHDKGVDLAFTIVVQDTAQLEAVLGALQRVKTVRSVRRVGA